MISSSDELCLLDENVGQSHTTLQSSTSSIECQVAPTISVRVALSPKAATSPPSSASFFMLGVVLIENGDTGEEASLILLSNSS